jgi:Zn-dependent protease
VLLMDNRMLLDGLMTYLCFLPILTFHEFAHAWVAWKCGDDTARLLGRVSLNPADHIDPIGTIIIPLAAVFLGAANSSLGSFLIGWGKPVPVNIYNLRNRRLDDILVSLAGPGMNLLLALGLFILARVGQMAGSESLTYLFRHAAMLSIYLAFFNLLPIPPLDGSHVLKNLTSMSDEVYANLCRFGVFLVIIAIQIPVVQYVLFYATASTLTVMARMTGVSLG